MNCQKHFVYQIDSRIFVDLYPNHAVANKKLIDVMKTRVAYQAVSNAGQNIYDLSIFAFGFKQFQRHFQAEEA